MLLSLLFMSFRWADGSFSFTQQTCGNLQCVGCNVEEERYRGITGRSYPVCKFAPFVSEGVRVALADGSAKIETGRRLESQFSVARSLCVSELMQETGGVRNKSREQLSKPLLYRQLMLNETSEKGHWLAAHRPRTATV